MDLVRRDLYRGKPDKAWHSQKKMVKKAVLYPAKWLKQRAVPMSGERYQEIVQDIVATMVREGSLHKVAYMSRYLYVTVQRHMDHKGDAYYQEGKAIRNRVDVFLKGLEQFNRGPATADVVESFAQAEALIKFDKRKPGPRRAAPIAPAEPFERKVRSDALYFKLSPDQRAEIASRIATGASYRKIIELCATWEIKTSLGALTTYLKEKP
jgi:hypothetical protein